MVQGGKAREKQNACVKVKTKVMVIPQTVGRRRFILARRKKTSHRVQGGEIYYSQTEGEGLFMSHRCAVQDVQVSTGSRPKEIVLERHM